jgi:DNA replication protein DnaC
VAYDSIELKQELDENIVKLNVDKRKAYNTIINAVDKINETKPGGNVYFIDGPGGTGKTFLYSTILAKIRMKSDVALAVASSGIAALLLPGGRTAHSRFKIPLNLDKYSTCNIKVRVK